MADWEAYEGKYVAISPLKKTEKPFLVKFSAHKNRFIFVIFSGGLCMYVDNLGGQENITFVQRKKKKLWKRKDKVTS